MCMCKIFRKIIIRKGYLKWNKPHWKGQILILYSFLLLLGPNPVRFWSLNSCKMLSVCSSHLISVGITEYLAGSVQHPTEWGSKYARLTPSFVDTFLPGNKENVGIWTAKWKGFILLSLLLWFLISPSLTVKHSQSGQGFAGFIERQG